MIYVDTLAKCDRRDPTPSRWKYSHYARLWADSTDELHPFAKKIGLKRSYFHPHLKFYSVSARIRAKAVQAGAVQVERSAFSRHAFNAGVAYGLKIKRTKSLEPIR